MTNHWVDIKNADLVLIMGGNAAEAHPCGFKWVIEAKKQNKDEEKPKTKKKIVWQKPWKIENVDSAQVDVPDEDVEETSEEK